MTSCSTYMPGGDLLMPDNELHYLLRLLDVCLIQVKIIFEHCRHEYSCKFSDANKVWRKATCPVISLIFNVHNIEIPIQDVHTLQ